MQVPIILKKYIPIMLKFFPKNAILEFSCNHIIFNKVYYLKQFDNESTLEKTYTVHKTYTKVD